MGSYSSWMAVPSRRAKMLLLLLAREEEAMTPAPPAAEPSGEGRVSAEPGGPRPRPRPAAGGPLQVTRMRSRAGVGVHACVCVCMHAHIAHARACVCGPVRGCMTGHQPVPCQPRIQVWMEACMHACALLGARSGAPRHAHMSVKVHGCAWEAVSPIPAGPCHGSSARSCSSPGLSCRRARGLGGPQHRRLERRS